MTPEDFLKKWAFPVRAAVDLARLISSERAKAREEQREACAKVVGLHLMPFAIAPVAVSSVEAELATLRATPLTATPLADRIAELERERDEARAEAKGSAASDMDSLQRLKAVEPALERARIERGDAERARDEWKVRAEKAEAALATLKAPRFPVMTDFGGGFSIPWSVVAPFERQASLNHGGQTLERLAERGGLSPRELWHMMHGRRFSVGKPHPDCPSEADCHAWALRLATP